MHAGQYRVLTAFVVPLAFLSACRHDAGTSGTTSTTATTATAAPPSAAAPRSVKWIDLAVGDCLVDVPQVDLGDLMATIVDCATPHKAEVFARAAMWVDATVPDVANRACLAELPKYTGQPVEGTPYTVSYLVDAHQDRTGSDPAAPGTAICLLENADGSPLTSSARG